MRLEGSPNFAAWEKQRPTGFGGNLTVVDTILPDMLHLVDAYWYQYAPLDPVWHRVLGLVIAILGFISITGNSMVIYIFITTKSLRTPSNMLVVNLAFSDFLLMLTMSPAMVFNCYFETWVLGPAFCQAYGMLGSLFGCGSIWTMTYIAMDRYNVIVNGLSAVPLTKKSVAVHIVSIWSMALVWTLAPFFGWNRYVPEGNMTACGTDYLSQDISSVSYIIAYAIFVYFMPLCIIIYAYWFIVRAVASHEKSMRKQAKKMNVASLRTADADKQSVEFKLAKITMITIFLWFVAWTPYMVTNVSGITGKSQISPLATIWASVFAKAGAAYNPIVYGISHPKYRQVLHKKIPCLGGAGAGTTTDDATSQVSGCTNASDSKPAA
uniref:Long wavelength sensitive opsin 3 n=1 Tax=Nedyus quadrimaculatus TaxID=202049 RepID=A0A8F2T3H4_9CUCU|nr:long wavelength sensitive opsin 3 [Nedyus quadrimaculatus]